jgi:glutamate/aspartate transport system substrate-binding protein
MKHIRHRSETDMSRTIRFALITLAFALFAAPAAAQSLSGTLKKIKETNTITIGHRESSIPFSYLDDKQQPIGYAMDLCMKIVDAVKAELRMPKLKVQLQPVTSSNRIPLMQNGTIDLECGSTTNSVERQKQVAFGPTYFVINVTAAVKKSSGINSLADLNGKTISTTSGTTSVPLIKKYEKTRNVEVKEIYGKDHAESFLLVADDRAAAFVMDDILLAGQIANSRNPSAYRIIPESLRQEPYSMMLRKDDPQFKALVDRAVGAVMKSGEIERIYAKWFTRPIPPKGINLNFPMTPAIREAFANPNDKGV